MRFEEVMKEIVRSNASAWNTVELPEKTVHSCKLNTAVRIEQYNQGVNQREYDVEWAKKLGEDPVLDRPYYIYHGSSPIRQFSVAIVDNGSTVIPIMGANNGRISEVEYRIAQVLTQDDQRLNANLEYADIEISPSKI